MYRYKCEFSINLKLAGTEQEAITRQYGSIGRPTNPKPYSGEIWLKIEPKEFVYFEGNPKAFYIAPVSINMAENLVFSGTDKNGDTVSKPELNNLQNLNPDAQGDMMGIWYGSTNQLSEGQLLSYQGQNLDPSIFRTEYYTRIDLTNFQALNQWGFMDISHDWWFPSVQLNLTVYVYVVGEWQTYQQPTDYPEHLPSPISWGSVNFIIDWISGLFDDIFSNIYTTILFIALLVFVAFWLITRSKRKSGKADSGSGEKKKYFGLSLTDLIVYGGLGVLALLPVDPTDVLDFGTPALELVGVGVYYFLKKRRGAA
jgi:hypothetical protein